MTGDFLITADARSMSGAEFFRAVFGRRVEPIDTDAYWEARDEKLQRELDRMRINIMHLAGDTRKFDELKPENKDKWL